MKKGPVSNHDIENVNYDNEILKQHDSPQHGVNIGNRLFLASANGVGLLHGREDIDPSSMTDCTFVQLKMDFA